MITYHYHAICQTDPTATNHIDGIASLEKPILTMEDYLQLKTEILNSQEDLKEKDVKLTICSLTVIHNTHEQ